MDNLLINSELDTLLNGVPAMDRRQLGESEYLALVRLYCTEQKRHAPGRRHADTIDFDRAAMDLVIDLVPEALAAKQAGKDRDYMKVLARIGALTAAAMLQAVNDKLDGELLQKRAAERMRINAARGEDLSGHDWKADYMRDAEARGIEAEEIEVTE